MQMVVSAWRCLGGCSMLSLGRWDALGTLRKNSKDLRKTGPFWESDITPTALASSCLIQPNTRLPHPLHPTPPTPIIPFTCLLTTTLPPTPFPVFHVPPKLNSPKPQGKAVQQGERGAELEMETTLNPLTRLFICLLFAACQLHLCSTC